MTARRGRDRACRWWWVLVAALVAGPSLAAAMPIDPATSSAGFKLKTRWGQTLDGRFPGVEGEIVVAEGQRKRVLLRLSTRDVEIVGHPKYTRLTRGDGFFDSARHPNVVFISDAYPETLVRDGGKLAGVISIRGVTRREVFTVAPGGCERPGIDCDVVATGVVYRGDFQMERWAFALSDRVQLTLRLRVRSEGG